MLAKAAVQNNFQHFNINDNETCIDKKMHHCHQGISKHFLLPECKQQYIFPALGRSIAVIFIMAEQNIPPDLFYIFRKKPDSKKDKNDK